MPALGSVYKYPGMGGTYRVKVTKVTATRVSYKILDGPGGSTGASRSMTRNQWAAKVGR